MDKNPPIQPQVGKNSSQGVKSEFEEPKLTELGNLRDMTTQMAFSPPPIM